MRFKPLILFITVLNLVFGSVFYGRCHHFNSTEYPDEVLTSFVGDRGSVDFFSNVRFERLFEHQPVQEKYISDHVIQLRYTNETGEDCFYPFEFVRKLVNASTSSTRTQNVTQINTQVIEIRNDDHLLAFSCFEDGYRNLEFVWVVRRKAARMMSLTRAQEAFGDLLDATKTLRMGLMEKHHQLPFCENKFWATVVYCLAGIVAIAAIGAVVIYWKYTPTSMLGKESASSMEHGELTRNGFTFQRSSVGIS